MNSKNNRGQYSVEMLIILFMLFLLFAVFYIQFTDDRRVLTAFIIQDEGSAQLSSMGHCLQAVESLGLGSTCAYYTAEKIRLENYSLAAYQNSTLLSATINDVIVFSTTTAQLNQTYTNLSKNATVSFFEGEVIVQ